MGKFTWSDVKCFLDKYDLSGAMNECAVRLTADEREDTTFASGGVHTMAPGTLITTAVQLAGFWEAGEGTELDDALFGKVGAADVPMTIIPTGGAEGDLAFTMKAVTAQYAPGAEVGELLRYSARGQANTRPVRGVVAHNATRNASGNGGVRPLGALLAGQSLFAALHVLEAPGAAPTLTVKIQSDDAAGFASPIDRIVFPAMASRGSQWGVVAGPVTDTQWRVNFTIAGGGSFRFVVALGIL